ncbi:MAG: hypothetical protein HYX90_03260, partial [Chloroflexi bacterium]|nr:hypothetical protein [Chloroflexota bacterium]
MKGDSMLDPLDEYFCHQTPQPIGRVHTSDRRAYERYWLSMFTLDGQVRVTQGMGVYPNTGVMDGYALVFHKGRQHNLRVSKELTGPRHPLQIGPLYSEVVQPLKTWQAKLSENDSGVTYDLVWEGTTPILETPFGPIWEGNRLVLDWFSYRQIGRCRGQITVDGETYKLKPTTFRGVRDHSWGIRPRVGGPLPEDEKWAPLAQTVDLPPSRRREVLFHTALADFGDVAVHHRVMHGRLEQGAIFYPLSDRRSPQRLTHLEETMRFSPRTRHFEGAELQLTDERGRKTRMVVKCLSPTLLRGAGYGDINGWEHGKPRGKYD